jgi:hypothetical protein
VPGCTRGYFSFDGATSEDWKNHVAHHHPVAAADALGTAIVGLAGDPVRAAEECYEGPYGGPHNLLTRFYPELSERVVCPVCHNAKAVNLSPLTMFNMLWHVQDTHGWTREQVAAWLKGEGH